MSVIILEGEPSVSNPLVTTTTDLSITIDTVVPTNTAPIEFSGSTSAGESISTLHDVDLVGLENDSFLLFKQSINKWIPGKKLETHTIEAGRY